MGVWVKNVIGLSLACVLIVIAWRFFQGAEGSVKIWESEINVKASMPQPSATSKTSVNPRVPEVIPESPKSVTKTKTQRWTADSDWRKGGSSPDAFCATQRAARQKLFPERKVVLLSKKEDHKSEYTPFKHDYYRYWCEFEDQWKEV